VPRYGLALVWNLSFDVGAQTYKAVQENRYQSANKVKPLQYIPEAELHSYLTELGVKKINGVYGEFDASDTIVTNKAQRGKPRMACGL